MNRLRTTITAAAALTALLATTAAGCGSDGGTSAHPGRTLVVPGSGAPVDCKQVPYDYALHVQEPDGTGIVVDRGHVRGAVWVSCTGVPASFKITVMLRRNGLLYGGSRTYADKPDSFGYAATIFAACLPGVYRLQYSYSWSALGGTLADTTTAPISETVTQHDCDA